MMRIALALFYLLLKLGLSKSTTVLTRVENLMMVHENSSTDVLDYWNLNRTDNNPSDDRQLMPIYRLITGGNFRSGKVDHWGTNPPNEVAVMFFNNIGDLQCWMVFNTRNSSRDLTQWMRVNRLLGSLIMNMYQMTPVWNQPGYQFLFSSSFETNKAWFAVSNRNIYTDKDEYPYFIIPLRDSVPFTILQESENIRSRDLALLGEFGPFTSLDVIQIDLSGLSIAGITYIRAVLADNLVSGSGAEHYTLLYSTDVCNTEDRVTYRLLDGIILQLQTGRQEEIETLRVRCLWLNFGKVMGPVGVKLYGPGDIMTGATCGAGDAHSSGTPDLAFGFCEVSTQQDFIHLPIMVFRGFWYSDGSETTLGPTTTKIHTTVSTRETTPTVGETTTPRTCRCSCHSTHINNSRAAIDLKIQILKRILAVNKTTLSSHVRKYISVPDDRASAAGIGYVAGVVLGLVFTTIVVLDLSSLFHYLGSLWKCIREDK